MGGLQHKEEGKVVVSHFQVHLIYAQDLLNKNPEIHQFFTYGSDRTNYGSDSRLSCTPSLPPQRLHLSVAADTPHPISIPSLFYCLQHHPEPLLWLKGSFPETF